VSLIKSLSVGDGDLFYIKHGSDNFTIIDCCLSDDNKKEIVDELKAESEPKRVKRFISSHPDEDHFQGIEYLDRRMPIVNFYCVQNEATKDDESESFKRYCSLRDGENAYYVSKGCSRRWLNESSDNRGSSGIHVLWPDTSNASYRKELDNAKNGIRFNNIFSLAYRCFEMLGVPGRF
jgi:beta-lactamase superfamily II metal-dependent hydrolase